MLCIAPFSPCVICTSSGEVSGARAIVLSWPLTRIHPYFLPTINLKLLTLFPGLQRSVGSKMDKLMEKMAHLDGNQLSSQDFQLSILTALEEVTQQQRNLRKTLDKLVRKENREEVRHLLELTEPEESDSETLEDNQG